MDIDFLNEFLPSLRELSITYTIFIMLGMHLEMGRIGYQFEVIG